MAWESRKRKALFGLLPECQEFVFTIQKTQLVQLMQIMCHNIDEKLVLFAHFYVTVLRALWKIHFAQAVKLSSSAQISFKQLMMASIECFVATKIVWLS